MKLYTLQECFEALGNVFPFAVTFKEGNSYYCKEIIFYSKKQRINYMYWYTDESSSDHKAHFYWASQKIYSYKKQQYNKDFKKLLK